MDYELFTALENETGHDSKCNLDVSGRTEWPIRERNRPSCKETPKAALGLLLLGALVGLCVLGVLYYKEKSSHGALTEQYSSTAERLSVQEHNASELKSRLDQVLLDYQNASKHLESFRELKSHWDRVQANYENAVQRLELFKEECQKCALCGEGWTAFGVKCYYFSTDELNWTMSRDYCAGKGSHLVIITSRDEQDFVSSRITEHHWIGLNDLETEGKWMWVNKQTLTETGVTFWYQHENGQYEPDNWTDEDPSGENCVSLGNNGGNPHKWFDASCSELKNYICEK